MRSFLRLRKCSRSSIIFRLSIRGFATSKSTRPPGKSDPEFGLRARSSGGTDLEKHESSPRLAARDGMEQEPYEFWICPANLESKGEATHGAFRKYAFLASQKMIFLSVDPHSELPESVQRPRYTREVAGPGE